MAKSIKQQMRLGVAGDASSFQPTLNDCLATVVQQSGQLASDVLAGLARGLAPVGPQSIPAFQQAGIRAAVESIQKNAAGVRETFSAELSRIVYEGGGKEQAHTEVLRYEDLQLFGDAELDQSIEVARALQEVSIAVDDVLPTIDALVSTLLGWRTIQPGLNPIRPDVFVRALQATMAVHVPEGGPREAIITPAGGLLGVSLRRLYREISDWLVSTGIEPAVPIGGKLQQGGGAVGAAATGTMAKTLLNLDRLRKLLHGDFDVNAGKAEFLHTVPASLAMLQEMKQVDALVKRLEDRPKAQAAAPAQPAAAHEGMPPPRLGRQLGDEVLRLMFDTLAQDQRLLPAFKEQLRSMEKPVQKLAGQDSRFFSDRTHPGRMLLDKLTQRSLAFKDESDEGFRRFMETVQYATRWVSTSKVADADTFGDLLDHLSRVWTEHDQTLRVRREEAARALLHAEQRNLLAQKLAADFEQATEGAEVPAFVLDFLKGSWAQVVAEAQLSCTDGSDDPFGYRALVDDLVWSVQKSTAQRGRVRRLAQLVPTLLAKLREGLKRMNYPDELTQRFFDSLMVLHQSALQEGKDAAARKAAEALDAEPAVPDRVAAAEPYIAETEAMESGWIDDSSLGSLPSQEELAAAGIPVDDAGPQPQEQAAEPAAEPPDEPVVATGELKRGTWAELMVDGGWTRVQLTWLSPHGTLFMFTSQAGTAHSMSRRTLDKLRSQGLLRVIAQRNVIDEALDQVAQAALKNSLDGNKGE